MSAPQVLPFPLHVLPEPARRLAEDGARSLNCPPDLVALPILAALGTAIGPQRVLRVKPGWDESAVVYGAMVGPPGDAKSPALAMATLPLHEAEKWLAEIWLAAAKEAREKQRKQAVSKQVESERKNGAAANKQQNGAAATKQQTETHAEKTKEDTGEGKTKQDQQFIQLPRLVSTDATTEALALVMQRNEFGLQHEQDELSSLTASFNRYRSGLGADREFFQAAWSRKPIRMDRVRQGKGRRQPESIYIPSPFISVVGGIQPDVLGKLSDERGREDGFIHRFLFSYPESLPREFDREGVAAEVVSNYQMMIDRLLRLPVSDFDAGVVTFTPGALEVWEHLMRAHIAQVNSPGFPDYLRGPWRKLEAYFARFCLILQCARFVCREADTEEVDEITAVAAGDLVEYFGSHARKVYSYLRAEPESQKLTRLHEWLVAHGGTATAREVYKAGVAGCRESVDVIPLFERLQRDQLGHMSTENRSGPKTIRFTLADESENCR